MVTLEPTIRAIVTEALDHIGACVGITGGFEVVDAVAARIPSRSRATCSAGRGLAGVTCARGPSASCASTC